MQRVLRCFSQPVPAAGFPTRRWRTRAGRGGSGRDLPPGRWSAHKDRSSSRSSSSIRRGAARGSARRGRVGWGGGPRRPTPRRSRRPAVRGRWRREGPRAASLAPGSDMRTRTRLLACGCSTTLGRCRSPVDRAHPRRPSKATAARRRVTITRVTITRVTITRVTIARVTITPVMITAVGTTTMRRMPRVGRSESRSRSPRAS